jgi:hypothetical protein
MKKPFVPIHDWTIVRSNGHRALRGITYFHPSKQVIAGAVVVTSPIIHAKKIILPGDLVETVNTVYELI